MLPRNDKDQSGFHGNNSNRFLRKPFENKTNEISVMHIFVHDICLGAQTKKDYAN